MSAYSRRKPALCTCPHWCSDCELEKCPEKQETHFLKGTLTSEYLEQYVKKAAPIQRIQRQHDTSKSAPFRGNTLYRIDFVPHQASPRHSPTAKEQLPSARIPFNGQSSYQTHFTPKKANLSSPKKPAADDWKAPFYGSTTSQDSFKDWGALSPVAKAPEIAIRSMPFEGSTTYRDDYTKKQPALNVSRLTPQEEQSLNRPNYTTYGVAYVPQPLPAKKKSGCCADHTHTTTRTGHRSH